MKFTKMQGCGNDYVYIDGAAEKIPADKKPELVRRLSDRHFGIGSDGVIFINPAIEADIEMEMWNADGTRSEMCGNGIRCVAKYAYEKGLVEKKDEFSIITMGVIKKVKLTVDNGKVEQVRVNMGKPILEPENIPVVSPGERVVDEPLAVDGKEYRMTCISVGNPHCVIFTDNVKDMKLEDIGPSFENHERFPKRINTEFVRVIDRQSVEMRVWERGTGETLACGTGSSATAVACILNGLTDRKVTVHLLGGDLSLEWENDDAPVYMTGPAVTVFEGEIDF